MQPSLDRVAESVGGTAEPVTNVALCVEGKEASTQHPSTTSWLWSVEVLRSQESSMQGKEKDWQHGGHFADSTTHQR